MFNGTADGYLPLLSSIENQVGQKTYFVYNTDSGNFDYYHKNYSYAGYNGYFNLSKVTFPDSVSRYYYEKVSRNLGTEGLGEEFRMVSRQDQLLTYSDGSFQQVGDYNRLNYTYVHDYSGYPDYPSAEYMPATYTYASTAKVGGSSATNGLSTTTTFSNVGNTVKSETQTTTGERKVTTNLTFDSLYTSMPTKIQVSEYGAGDTDSTANTLYVGREYTDWGGIARETQPLTQAQYDDAVTRQKFTMQYTYEPVYHFLQGKSWYQNSSTPLSESYQYYADGRLKSYTNPSGETIAYCYEAVDADNNVTSNCSNPDAALSGKVQKSVQKKSLSSGKQSVTETIYGSETGYAYPAKTQTYVTVENGEPAVTVYKQMEYELGTGRLRKVTDKQGHATSYLYDLLGRVTSIQYPKFKNLGNEEYTTIEEFSYQDGIVSYGFDGVDADKLSMAVHTNRKSIQQSNGATTITSNHWAFYDGLGNLLVSQNWEDTRQHGRIHRPEEECEQ
jgi:YD repeat-containing protein